MVSLVDLIFAVEGRCYKRMASVLNVLHILYLP